MLNALTSEEGLQVLRDLLRIHPELIDEAVEIAVGILGDVDREDVAEDLVAAVEVLDLEALNARAGAQFGGGYLGPTEASWELLGEAVEPFIENIERLYTLRLAVAAATMLEGVVLGLYQLHERVDSYVLECAPDFAFDTAQSALRRWQGPSLAEGFIAEFVPLWPRLTS